MRKVIKKVAPRKAANTLPKKANGGKTGTKSVASAGAKKATTVAGNKAVSKLNNQGKPNTKSGSVSNYTITNSKGAVSEKWKNSGKDPGLYHAVASEVSRVGNAGKGSKITSLDTAGFSAGKRDFEMRTVVTDGKLKTISSTTKKVPRKSVPKTLKKMQTFRKGGKKC